MGSVLESSVKQSGVSARRGCVPVSALGGALPASARRDMVVPRLSGWEKEKSSSKFLLLPVEADQGSPSVLPPVRWVGKRSLLMSLPMWGMFGEFRAGRQKVSVGVAACRGSLYPLFPFVIVILFTVDL